MTDLPKLPGFSIEDRFKTHYHLPKAFEIVNGYNIPLPVNSLIGDHLPAHKTVAFVENNNVALCGLESTFYGRVKKPIIEPFRPKFVIFDKMALCFKAFFKQSVPESPLEHYRIRHVNIIYFLEDDSIKVMEPGTKNSGIQQGMLIRRSKITKNIKGEIYTWKDFNIGIDIELNGIVFHITDCDLFTKDFLISQGVELNDAEISPIDPVTCEKTINRLAPVKQKTKESTADDKLRRFLEFQGKILRFDCILDETDEPGGKVNSYQLFYFLEDDTVSIREAPENLEGTERCSMLLKKTKLPKNWKKKPTNFPSICMEVSDEEVEEYYQPKDFRIGDTIFVYGRRFLLLDCDKFTRKYYEEVLKNPQAERLIIKFPETPQVKRKTPDYLGLGTPEDSMASYYHLRPKPPKKDIKKYILNANKFLRYGCVLDSAHPEDKTRKFILSYSLSDDTISIMEPPVRNSGIIGGKFLNSQRCMLPNCDRNEPIYYEPKHFYIGAILVINDHLFKIVSADYYAYKYMKEHPELFSSEAIKSVQKSLLLEGNLKDEIKNAILKDIHQEDENQDNEKENDINKEKYYDIEKCLQDVNIHENQKSQQSSKIEKIIKNEKLQEEPLKSPYNVVSQKDDEENYQNPKSIKSIPNVTDVRNAIL